MDLVWDTGYGTPLTQISIPPFFISYIFKGESYHALQKINYFVNHIQKENMIWEKVNKYFQKSKTFHLKDTPLLESIINETFITKNVAISD